LISNGSVKPSLSGLGRNNSHKKFQLIKYQFVIQAIMPFLIRSNYRLYSSRLEAVQLYCYINYRALKFVPIKKYTTRIRTSPKRGSTSNTESYAMLEFSNMRFLVVGSKLGSRGCLSWNCPETITNNCAHQVSKSITRIVYKGKLCQSNFF